MLKVMVTGGNGFIGGQLINYFSQNTPVILIFYKGLISSHDHIMIYLALISKIKYNFKYLNKNVL